MLVVQAKKKPDYNTKISRIGKKKLLIIIMINILLLHNKYTAEIFTARLAQSNLIPKTDFDTILISLNNKQTQIKQNINFLKMNFKNYKHLIQFILKAKVILKKMVQIFQKAQWYWQW